MTLWSRILSPVLAERLTQAGMGSLSRRLGNGVDRGGEEKGTFDLGEKVCCCWTREEKNSAIPGKAQINNLQPVILNPKSHIYIQNRTR